MKTICVDYKVFICQLVHGMIEKKLYPRDCHINLYRRMKT